MKTLLALFLVLSSFSALAANSRADQFDLGCLSWDEVKANYDLSQISEEQTQQIRTSHQRARKYLAQVDTRFASFDGLADLRADEEVFNKVAVICAITEEATFGFSETCVDDSGQEMISDALVEGCLALQISSPTNS